MSDRPNELSPVVAESASGADADLTGQRRMVQNVLASWGGHLAFIVAGFILPRFMDRHLGQDALGVWDFGWSVVGYLGLVQMGISSSVNRYVAKHRAAGDAEGLRCAMSSVYWALLVAATLIAALSITASYLVPWLAGSRLGAFTADARWVVLWLGSALAIQVAFVVYDGVITGCHRWGLHNGINAGFHAAIVSGMIVALVMGRALPTLALVYCCGVAVTEVTRAVVAYHVCPDLRVHFRFARWSSARRMITFGGKTFVPRIAELLLDQTTSILILAYLGPATLALYSRPRALVRHVRTLVGKLAFVLTPVASSLQATQDKERVRDLLINSTRYAAYIALPLILLLTILGDSILLVWMGPQYAAGLVLAILAVGFLATVTHQTVLSILTGLNAHGKPGIAKLGAAICSVVLVVLTLGPLHWGLAGAAIAVTLPLAIVDGIYVPLCACRRLGLSLRAYLLRAYRGPVACALPFSACLLLARALFADRPSVGLACGLATGGLILLLAYWKYALPARARSGIATLVNAVAGRFARARL
ncbi:MAG: oligosaccharide flippase family protein [Phycisphaerae bacterium]|nr:oligosaccharide flippase family protein [Phycisphaerae bacterium]